MEQLRNLKRKTYEGLNEDQRTEGPVEEQSGSRTKQVKQEDISIIGTGFHLGGQGVGDECGEIQKAVQGSEEVVDREVRRSIGGEENIGYIV